MRSITLWLLLVLLQASSAQSPQEGANGSIAGIAVSATTNEPIEDARLTLTPEALPPPAFRPTPLPSVATGSDGKFVFQGLTAGRYRLEGAANGYVRQEYGQKDYLMQGALIDLRVDQVIDNLVIRLTPTGNVSGRIRDAEKQPLADVPVRLLRAVYNRFGQRTLQSVASTRTNDRGEYRIYFVAPGRYYVNAGTSSNRTLDDWFQQRDSNVVETTYSSVYFPGVVDLNQAAILEVKPGADIDGIDLRLGRQELYRMRGRVIDSRTGQPPSSIRVSLFFRSDSGGERVDSNSNYRTSDGTFEFRGLIPGSYWVIAEVFTPSRLAESVPPAAAVPRLIPVAFQTGQTTPPQPAAAPLAKSIVPVDLGASDVEGILIAMTPGVSVSGRLRIEGQAPSTQAADLERMQIYLSARNELSSKFVKVPPPKATDAEWTFGIDGVTPGEYAAHVIDLPPGFYLKEASLGGSDGLHTFVQITASEAGTLNFVISPHAATVQGVVTDERLAPVPGSQVVLVPDRNRDRAGFYRAVTSDTNGRFSFPNVIPGDYRIFAWESIEPNAYFDPGLLKNVEAKGERLHLDESARHSVDVRVIPADDR
jgi:hypothetical protein